jgi:Leucine-rich repeat (LRR) protein
MYVRNVFRSGTIPQNMSQHFSDSYLWFIDLKQNNLIGIDCKVFQNLSHLNRLDASDNSIAIINYNGLLRLTILNIDHNNLREVPNFCSENGSSFVHHLRELHIVNNRVQVLKTNDFQCAVRIRRLCISNNPLREIQNNVLAPLKRLSSLSIIPSRHTLKHIQSMLSMLLALKV